MSGAIWYFAWLLFLTGLSCAVGVILALFEVRFLLALGFAVGTSLIFPAFWLFRKKDVVAAWLERGTHQK